jgi:hypothetical protein
MGRPSRTSFAKREKERARSERRQLKLARKHGSKVESGSAPEEEGAPPVDPGEQDGPDPGKTE